MEDYWVIELIKFDDDNVYGNNKNSGSDCYDNNNSNDSNNNKHVKNK